ncbi:hypothetical protein SDC9_02489 [bioreactor metagenome]|uniref:Uncharacterized protein n=1 Tax=bioreactor metagenome TaxID=1076179 RepID=A0A644SQS7_9ZZZZ
MGRATGPYGSVGYYARRTQPRLCPNWLTEHNFQALAKAVAAAAAALTLDLPGPLHCKGAHTRPPGIL